ncbi:MAG TPA: hypothetical protein VF215_03075 [Thermoanaerobaculia bacterium]
MHERPLSPVVRIIAGLLGTVILVVAIFVAFSQVRAGWGSDIRAWLAAIGLLIVALLALRVIHAAVRGTIRVRDRGTNAG